MESKYIKFIILAIEIISAAIVTKFFQNMVYTDIILMILTLGISFYIALHYEYEIKQEKKWVEFEKEIFEKLDNQDNQLSEKLQDQKTDLAWLEEHTDRPAYSIDQIKEWKENYRLKHSTKKST